MRLLHSHPLPPSLYAKNPKRAYCVRVKMGLVCALNKIKKLRVLCLVMTRGTMVLFDYSRL